MALDGLTVNSIIHELNSNILNGRIDKINQPGKDFIIIAIRCGGKNQKLLLTASSNNPRIQITDEQSENPFSPPLFCMVLRKHLTSGKILNIKQPEFERVIEITIESFTELGDKTQKRLIIEIMGKHSNIILVDDRNIILECIKHITNNQSSLREVLPGRPYQSPPTQNKENPQNLEFDTFKNLISQSESDTISKAIYTNYQGISPVLAREILFRANLEISDNEKDFLSENTLISLFNEFSKIMEISKTGNFSPKVVINEKGKVIEFAPFELKQFEESNLNYKFKEFDSISPLLGFYYEKKDKTERISQKTQDLKKLIKANIERCLRKKELQVKTLKDIKNRDTLKLYGELITSYIYTIKKGMTMFTCENFYASEENINDNNNENTSSQIEIPLDPTLTPPENAQKYFKQYNKEKRTHEAILLQMSQNDDELIYLDSMAENVNFCENEADILAIREELAESGYVKRRNLGKKANKNAKKSKPMEFISSSGNSIFVGKNNTQNDDLTLKFAHGTDIWLHAKDMPGSHVIIRTNNEEVSEKTIEEAAHLAAFFSKGKNSSNVPIDYTIVKNVKKPSGAKPGMVIYVKNKTAYITPNENIVKELQI